MAHHALHQTLNRLSPQDSDIYQGRWSATPTPTGKGSCPCRGQCCGASALDSKGDFLKEYPTPSIRLSVGGDRAQQ